MKISKGIKIIRVEGKKYGSYYQYVLVGKKVSGRSVVWAKNIINARKRLLR